MSGPLSTTLVKSIGGTENAPHPYRWVVNTPENLASIVEPTLKATDLHKQALITSTGVTLRLSNVSPAQWSPMGAKDLELTSRVSAAETKIVAAEKKINTAETKINTAETKITASEKKINTAETKITASEKKINTAETKITAAETKINTATTNIGSVTGRVTAAEKKITASETKIAAAETKINTATTNISSVTGKVTAAEKKITASETKIAAAETKITAAETKIGAAETKIVSINNLKSLGYDLDVKTVTNGVINVNAGQAFKIPSSGSRSISISNATTTGRMRTIAIMIEGAGAVTWPATVKWTGGAAPVLGSSYTLIVLAIFESRLSGHVASSV